MLEWLFRIFFKWVFKELYETDFFKNINFDLNDGLLTIVVEENLIIEKLNINGIKKSFVEQLYSALSLKIECLLQI